VNNGLRSLVIDVYDVSMGVPEEVLHERIRFAAYDAFPSGTVNTTSIPLGMGHKYMVTATPNGPKLSSCTVEDMFRQAIPPVAAMTVTVNYLMVTVDGSGSTDDGSIESYAWNFGDGSSASGMTATHTYAWDGTFTISLTVTDNDGLTGSASETVTVVHEPMPPVASFTATMDYMVVSVNAGASSDPDRWIETYAWEFGDGGVASGVTATHTYTTPGTYTIILTVTDDEGLTGTASKMVEAKEKPALVPPVASFTVSKVYREVTVDASGSTDADGLIVSYEWNFGDLMTATGKIVTHTYAADGTYTITLKVTDNDGLSDDDAQSVTVEGPDMPPVPDFTISVDGLTVSVNAALSTDDKGIVSYEWNWGDGSPVESGVTASHTYDVPSRSASAAKASAIGPAPMQPPPPYNVIGYTKDDKSNLIPFCTVTITNVRTAVSVVVTSDANSFYMYNLNDLPSGWVVGDTIHVKAEKGTMVGENTGIAEGGAYLWIDVVLQDTALPPFDVTITLTVTDSGGNKVSISKTVTLYP
jgi:PKD repeat protein